MDYGNILFPVASGDR